MRLANVGTILVKVWARLSLADRAEIFGDADVGIDQIIGVEDDFLSVDLVEAHAHPLLNAEIGERHVGALVGHSGLRPRVRRGCGREARPRLRAMPPPPPPSPPRTSPAPRHEKHPDRPPP